jgi:tetratricopeptide (TPR) repeat protein
MSYPGNSAISPEVQQRIRSTFEQTLGLAERGSRQEAALGCDFILQLDPQFRPAQALQDRLRSTDGAVTVDDLRDELAGRTGRVDREAEAAELFGAGGAEANGGGLGAGGMDDLDATLPALDDLPDLPEIDMPGADAAPSSAPPPQAADRQRLADLVEQRRFAEVLEIAAAHRDEIVADPELARLATVAGERNEAAPYVDRFLASAERARQRGDAAEAGALLDKARELDPSHPALRQAGAAAASPAAGAPPAAPPTAPSPPAAPAAPEPFAADADDLDFGSGDAEGDRRIAELLAEGQQAFERGDHQSAIDAWSRIFLIDIDHQEASRRIEEARRLKNEQERKIEEVYHEALDAAQAGREAEAREGFERVLALAPGHGAALEQIERLESGRPLAPPPSAVSETPAEAPEPPAPESAEPLKEEILVPPEPGAAPPPAAGRAAAGSTRTMVATGRTPRRFLLIGSLVLVVVLAAGWLLWENRASIFPNADEAPVAVAPAEVDPIARATRLHEAGRTAIAVNQLRRLPPESPQYEEAQALISQWEAEGQPAAVPEAPGGADAEAEQRQVDLIEQAAAAAATGEYLRARSLLTEAETLAPLPAGSESLKAEVEAQVEPLVPQLELMEMGEYSRALPDLWRLHQADPDDPDVRHLIADAYYNLAVRSLQQGDAEGAAEHLEEAAEVSPDDPALARHLRFAQTYAQRDKDLLYRIYVKYLPPR